MSFPGFSQPQAPPTFQGTIVNPSQSIQANLNEQLQTTSANYRMFTINIEIIEDYLENEDGDYLFNIRLDDDWEWTFDMTDYSTNSHLSDFLLKNKAGTTSSGRAFLAVVNEILIGAIESGGDKYRFLPAKDILGASWDDHFLVYKDPHYTYVPPIVHSSETAIIEIGFEADYELFQHFGGDDDAREEITGRIGAILDDAQVFYEQSVDVSFLMQTVQFRTAPDPYTGSATQVASAVRGAWNSIYSCIPVDGVILFSGSQLPHNGKADFLHNGQVFCEGIHLPVAYVDVTPGGALQASTMGQGSTSLTLAHEIGHWITQRGFHTEDTGPDCPPNIINLCGGSNNVPIMCNENFALGLGSVFLPQCDIEDIISRTVVGDAGCLNDMREVPEELPCSNCVFEIRITADNPYPVNNCGNRNEVTYNMEVCNYCGSQDLEITYISSKNSQTIIEIDPLFTLTNDLPGTAEYATELFMEEGECRQFQFKAVLTNDPNPLFKNTLKVDPLESTHESQMKELDMLLAPNHLNVVGATGTQTPLKLSSVLEETVNALFRSGTVCGNTTTLKSFAFSGVTEIDLDDDIFTYTINGTTIQNSYCLYNSRVKLDENAKIIVKNGTLNISNSRIFGCSSLWNSIIVESGATLIIENSYIEDGEYAIRAKSGARVEIKNCTFRDNYVAFHVTDVGSGLPQTVNLTQFYGNTIETQDALLEPRAGQPAYTGMLLENATGIIVGNEAQNRNEFRGLRNGIIAKRSNLEVRNSSFQDIGSNPSTDHAVYAEASPLALKQLFVKGFGKQDDPVFSNCVSAVSARRMYAIVTQCNMEEVHFGIRSYQGVYCKLNFSDNQINADGVAGISLYNNTPARITVENNTLFSNHASAVGILVSENPVALADHAANRIANNTINLKNGRAGILSYSGRYLEFYKNTVNLQLDDKQSAIQIQGLADGLVRCNYVYGLAGTTLNARGMAARGAHSTIFSCNHLFDTKIGMSFDGMGDQSEVRGNEFTGQVVGLQIEMNGHIGPQNHQGNRWFGSFGEFGAKHLGSTEDIVDQSKFTVDVDEAIGQDFVFLPTLSSIGQWFEDQDVANPATDIFYCTTTSNDACATTSPPVNIKDGLGDLENKLSRGNFSSPQFTTELTWTGRRHLYSRIAENNIPLQNNGYVNSFYTNAANTSIEYLHEARQSIKDALTLSTTDESALEGFAGDIEGYLNDLHQNSKALSVATTSNDILDLLDEREDILDDLTEVVEDADALTDDLYDDMLTSIGAAKTVNASVSATAVYELNEKDYNDLFLTAVEEGELTTTQKEALWDIANQCPLEGGDGVYHARSLYAVVDPAASYNDLTLCSGQQQLFKPGQRNGVETQIQFDVYPNPAKDLVTFHFHQNPDELITLEIFHPSGHSLHRQSYELTSMQIQVETPWPSGVYFCRIRVNGQSLETKMFAILK